MDNDKIIGQENQPEVNHQEEPVVEEAPQDMDFDQPPPIYKENNNQNIFIIGGAILFLILLVIIIRAIFFNKPSNKAVSLLYWGLWEDKEVMEPLIVAYQNKYPNVKITYQKMNPQSYREK